VARAWFNLNEKRDHSYFEYMEAAQKRKLGWKHQETKLAFCIKPKRILLSLLYWSNI